MKLIVQIPCFNEAETLSLTVRDIPRQIDGIDSVEILVIDDGSTDGTYEVSANLGVEHIVRHRSNLGLARSFITGIEECLRLGADIIVNTDADSQYNGQDIPKLVEPILSDRADLVVGTRPVASISHFSATKKLLQKLGSWVVRLASGLSVEDAPSGFRAFNRPAAARMNVFSSYTYTLETLIQASRIGLAVESVPIRVGPKTRESRLIRSIPRYLVHSAITLIRILITYSPLKFFLVSGSIFIALGSLIGFRFLYFYSVGQGGGHIQSLIATSILIIAGFQLCTLGIISDLISVNRKLLEELKVSDRLASDPEMEQPSPSKNNA